MKLVMTYTHLQPFRNDFEEVEGEDDLYLVGLEKSIISG